MTLLTRIRIFLLRQRLDDVEAQLLRSEDTVLDLLGEVIAIEENVDKLRELRKQLEADLKALKRPRVFGMPPGEQPHPKPRPL